jgi:polyhydroxyalkanoate synthesis regulator phasin
MFMMKVFKEMMVTGLGALFLTKDKLQEMVDELVEQGKMSREEAAEMVEEMMTKAKEQRNDIEERITEDIKENLDKAGLTSKEKVEKLEGRVKSLELQVQSLEAKLENEEEDID